MSYEDDVQDTMECLANAIPDISTVVTVKVQIPETMRGLDTNDMWEYVDKRRDFINQWLIKEMDSFPVVSTCGIHLDGVHGKPHAHIHFIFPVQFQIKSAAARSNSRTRFIQSRNECGFAWGSMREVTFKFDPLDLTMPKWQILAYPLKERIRSPDPKHYFYYKKNMIRALRPMIVDTLENVGGAIFDAAKALRERQDACRARKLNNLEEMYKYAFEHRSKFKTFREMREFLEDNLLGPDVPLEDIPVIKNYNNNVFIVGKKLGLVRYCDYDP